MALATSSLPVPVSPSMSTVTVVGASMPSFSNSARMAGVEPTRGPKCVDFETGTRSLALRGWKCSNVSPHRRVQGLASKASTMRWSPT